MTLPSADSGYDVIIIGAGAAGLAAAAELSRSGRRILVLEARDRLGGRVLTRLGTNGGRELGAEFVHGRAPEILELAARHHIPLQSLETEQWVAGNEGWEQDEDNPSVDDVFARMSRKAVVEDMSFQEFLTTQEIPKSDRQMLTGYVEGYNAADASEAGIAWLDTVEKAEAALGPDVFLPAGGYIRLLDALRSECQAEVLCNCPVREIQWSSGDVQVLASGRSFHATRVLVTVPLGVLQHSVESEEGLRFVPPLPDAFVEAIAGLRMGQVCKVTIDASRDQLDRLPSDGFFFTPEAPFPVWWKFAGSIAGWVGGPAAGKLLRQTSDDIRQAAWKDFGKLLNSPINPGDWAKCVRFHPWHSDPYSLGAYSYVPVYGQRHVLQLGESIQDTVYFAGEALHQAGRTGTVDGAMATGYSAARKICTA